MYNQAPVAVPNGLEPQPLEVLGENLVIHTAMLCRSDLMAAWVLLAVPLGCAVQEPSLSEEELQILREEGELETDDDLRRPVPLLPVWILEAMAAPEEFTLYALDPRDHETPGKEAGTEEEAVRARLRGFRCLALCSIPEKARQCEFKALLYEGLLASTGMSRPMFMPRLGFCCRNGRETLIALVCLDSGIVRFFHSSRRGHQATLADSADARLLDFVRSSSTGMERSIPDSR